MVKKKREFPEHWFIHDDVDIHDELVEWFGRDHNYAGYIREIVLINHLPNWEHRRQINIGYRDEVTIEELRENVLSKYTREEYRDMLTEKTMVKFEKLNGYR